MTDEAGDADIGPISEEAFARALYAGEAVYGDRLGVVERDGVFRIGVVETTIVDGPVFRGAVAISLKSARDLRAILDQLIEKVEERDGQR